MYIKVLVKPGAKKEKIETVKSGDQLKNDHFVVAVKEKAERNAANMRVLDVLSAFLRVPRTALKIISGHHSRSKIISVNNDF